MASKTGQVHGRDHGANGSDPVPGIILFNKDNQGGYLYVTSNDAFTYAATASDFGIVFDDQTGQGILFDLHDPSSLGRIGLTAASIALLHDSAISIAVSGGPQVQVNSTNVLVKLTTGTVFEVQNNTGSPIFRVDEDGDLHGKTGKTLTFDL